jgi:hypothetical protein
MTPVRLARSARCWVTRRAAVRGGARPVGEMPLAPAAAAVTRVFVVYHDLEMADHLDVFAGSGHAEQFLQDLDCPLAGLVECDVVGQARAGADVHVVYDDIEMADRLEVFASHAHAQARLDAISSPTAGMVTRPVLNTPPPPAA